jgi:hypothetical protein
VQPRRFTTAVNDSFNTKENTMKKIFALSLLIVLVLSVCTAARTVTRLDEKLGAFTGPVNGAVHDDNAKSALDHIRKMVPRDATAAGTGVTYYVDSGTDGTAGTSWSTAVGTIDEAVNLCTADRGDVILVAAGHSEALTAADGVDADSAGITIIGLGSGELRPVLDYTNANGEFVIGADDIKIYNLRFHANVTSITKAIDIEAGAENYVISDCVFDVETAATDEFSNVIIVGDASDGGLIKNCQFYMGGAAAVSAIYLDHDADYTRMVGNEVFGDYSTACIVSDTAASIHILIKDNMLFNGTTGGNGGLNTEPCIELHTSTTGTIIGNQCFCNVVSPADAIVAADCFSANNRYSEYEQAGGSEPIGKDLDSDVLAALGISMTDGTARGRVVYVDSGETTSIEDGLSWATAVDTLEEAVALCTASNGDTIFIAPGHAETIDTADEVDLDKHGMTVIGLGNGTLRPTFTFDDGNDGAWTIGADNITVKNLIFSSSVDSTSQAIEIEAGSTDVTIDGCRFQVVTAGTDEFDKVIDCEGAASDRLVVQNCEFYMENGESVAAIYTLDSDNCIFRDNIITGDYSTACINNATTASNHIVIKDNVLFNGTTGGNTGLNTEPCIELLDTTTGVVEGNRCCCNVSTAKSSIVAADCFLSNNTYTESESTTGSEPVGKGQADETKALGLLGQDLGNVIYVDSQESSGIEDGRSWETAVDTLEEAMALCYSNRANTVLIASGHTETIDTADEVDIDVAGTIVIGLGHGTKRPTFTFDDGNDGAWTIGADDVAVKNLIFSSSVDSTTQAIEIEAGSTDVLIENCRFQVVTAGTDEFDRCIDSEGAASDRLVVRGCEFFMANGEAVAAIATVDSDNCVFEDNHIFGDYSTACINNITTASNHIVIKNNILFNGTTGGNGGLNTEPCIELLATTTGMIVDNRCSCNVATPEAAIVALDCFLSNNTYTETEADGGGQLIGTVAGKTYCSVITAVDSNDADLFDVDGGPILITSFTGLVTTQITNATNNLEIVLDADSGYSDHDFTTAVDIDNDAAGTRYSFTNVAEAVLTPMEGADGGASVLMLGWFCGEGMIEQNASDADSSGVMSWYMTWIPFNDGTTVTPQ